MPEPANPEGPLPSVIESQPNHTPLSPQINSAQSTNTTEVQKPESQNPIQIKIQEIENCREQVIKEVEKIRRMAYGKPGKNEEGKPIIIGEHEETIETSEQLFERLQKEEESGKLTPRDSIGIRRALKTKHDDEGARLTSEINDIKQSIQNVSEEIGSVTRELEHYDEWSIEEYYESVATKPSKKYLKLKEMM